MASTSVSPPHSKHRRGMDDASLRRQVSIDPIQMALPRSHLGVEQPVAARACWQIAPTLCDGCGFPGCIKCAPPHPVQTFTLAGEAARLHGATDLPRPDPCRVAVLAD